MKNFWDVTWTLTNRLDDDEHLSLIRYKEGSYHFDATRSLRHFTAWNPKGCDDAYQSFEKDALTGKEEAILDQRFFEELQALLTEAQRDNRCNPCLLYTSPSPRDQRGSRMPSSA